MRDSSSWGGPEAFKARTLERHGRMPAAHDSDSDGPPDDPSGGEPPAGSDEDSASFPESDRDSADPPPSRNRPGSVRGALTRMLLSLCRVPGVELE